MNPMDLNCGIDATVKAAVDELKKIAKPCDDANAIRQVATVSANWSENVGGILADAVDKVGRDGVITIEGLCAEMRPQRLRAPATGWHRHGN